MIKKSSWNELKCKIELGKIRLDYKQEKLRIHRVNVAWGEVEAAGQCNVTKNLKLVPDLMRGMLTLFFPIFKRVADEEQTMLQCVFPGKAKEVYFSISAEGCKNYEKVKTRMIKIPIQSMGSEFFFNE